MPQALRDQLAAQNKAQKAITDALKEGEKTIPELAAATGMDTQKTLWYVTGLRKYGKVEAVAGRGVYPKYILKPVEAK